VNLLIIAIGGAIGSVARYALTAAVGRLTSSAFPFGTLAVNGIGCLAFGLIVGAAQQRLPLSNELRLFLLVGVLGGFTTFSTYAYEGVVLLQGGGGQGLVAALYIAGHVVAGLGAVWAGMTLAR
jgi:CrcB protein